MSVILVVEDDPGDVFLVRRAFTKDNLKCELRFARDGEEAVAYIAGEAEFGDRTRHPLPSLVLLDLKLPRRAGLEVLAWLKSQQNLKGIPVIVLTSSNQAADLKSAYELGANSYLVKPVTTEGLAQMVEAIGVYWLSLNVTPGTP